MSYDLPNPFLFLSPLSAGNAASVENHTPSPSAGAAPTYPDGFSARENLQDLLREGINREVDPALLREAQAALDRMDAFPRGFDPDAFASDIESVPAFLTRDIRADEIEELLELARAEEWPAPPRRMVG